MRFDMPKCRSSRISHEAENSWMCCLFVESNHHHSRWNSSKARSLRWASSSSEALLKLILPADLEPSGELEDVRESAVHSFTFNFWAAASLRWLVSKVRNRRR